MHTLEKLTDRFWYLTPVSETDRPILGVVVGDNNTLMIDAGNSEAHADYFLNELNKKQIREPNIVVLTHWHWDHIFGLSSLKNMNSLASKQTKEEMEKLTPLIWSDEALDERVREGTEIEFCATCIKKEFESHRDITITLPDVTFENRLEIDLGGVTCILQHVGGDHAPDSVVVFVKEEKILFLADCIYPDIFAEKRNYTTQRTLDLLDVLETFDADTYVLSHWKPISKDEFNLEVQLLRNIASMTIEFQGNRNNIIDAYENHVGRKLNEDELETIEYFVNGYNN
ncbi:MBL fold metallo-hydrolase [Bacillus sp. CGMCC 1.16607]|uniref:MBL fold metallo-hydrolase n=1 Tax=Bacillus sp. CGMCC 1.16607 TaxID=3351842 RepID=UPI0036431FB3